MVRTSIVTIHQSACPDATRARILASLQRAELDPSLLYSGLRQTSLWIRLHHALSPAQRDPRSAAIYQKAFDHVSARCPGNVTHVVSLACGDGTKDTRCLQTLRTSGRTVIYTPADFSLEMVLTSENAATSALHGLQCTPLLCELSHTSVLPAILKDFDPSGAERLILFLGTIHNYWPPEILRSIIYPLRSSDCLLLSANLDPHSDDETSLQRILSQYDNPPTREWLMGALSELSLSADDGTLSFSLVPSEKIPSLRRIQADFIFTRDKQVPFLDQTHSFAAGRRLRAFYSYRFTLEQIRNFLTEARLAISEEWIDPSGEEALFLCRRAA